MKRATYFRRIGPNVVLTIGRGNKLVKTGDVILADFDFMMTQNGWKFEPRFDPKKHVKETNENHMIHAVKQKRPSVRDGQIVEVKTPTGNIYVICGKNEDEEPIELFFNIGKQGTRVNVLLDALGRTISASLQHGVPIKVFADTLAGMSGEKFFYTHNGEKGLSAESLPDLISQLIDKHWIKKSAWVEPDMLEEHDPNEPPIGFVKTLVI